MDSFQRMKTGGFTGAQNQLNQAKEQLLLAQSERNAGGSTANVADVFNFDMNDEYSPSLMQYQPKPKDKQKKSKKKKKPERLPLEISYYNRAAINFLYILLFVVSVFAHLDWGIFAACATEIKIDMNIDDF